MQSALEAGSNIVAVSVELNRTNPLAQTEAAAELAEKAGDLPAAVRYADLAIAERNVKQPADHPHLKAITDTRDRLAKKLK